jgi:nitrite reductase/ring-hydroxylating ferredoxin subunit
MGEVKEKTLTCAGHGWEFDITNGTCTSNPGRDLIEYKILEKDDELIISKK